MTINPNKYYRYDIKSEYSYSDSFIERVITNTGSKGLTGSSGGPGISGVPHLTEEPVYENGKVYLSQIGGLIYMIEVIISSGRFLRVKFLERVPPEFEKNSFNSEVWISKSELITLEPLDKNVVRNLKINSIVSDDE